MAMNKHVLHEDIYYYTNAIVNPEKVIKSIEYLDDKEQSYSSINNWQQWNASNEESFTYGVYKHPKWNHVLIGNKDIDDNCEVVINSIRDGFFAVANDFKLSKGIEDSPRYDPVFGINRYSTGSGLGSHADSYDGNMELRFSMVAYLNDNYMGGEIEFLNQGVSVKPEAGSIIIFPSSLPYLHESKPTLSGHKYMCTAFWLYPKQD
jgi:hypothetical protein